jgi:septum formation protein
MQLLLASSSPRRKELLEAAGFTFDIVAAVVDEARHRGESPSAYVERLACEKARAGAAGRPTAVVIGADTAVVLEDEVLGKPADADDAERMLRRLGGRTHDVLTGVAVAHQGELHSLVERTTVWMRAWAEPDLARAIASGEPFDKAGAYAIQGYAARLIPRIEGSYSNVVGLPVEAVARLLARVT